MRTETCHGCGEEYELGEDGLCVVCVDAEKERAVRDGGPVTATDDDTFGEWVVLELMGHRILAGYLTEQEIAGKGFLRLDVPGDDGQPAATQLYNPAAVYCATPTTESTAREVARGRRPAPVQRWELEPPHAIDGDPF